MIQVHVVIPLQTSRIVSIICIIVVTVSIVCQYCAYPLQGRNKHEKENTHNEEGGITPSVRRLSNAPETPASVGGG